MCLDFILFHFVQPLCHPDQKLALLQFKNSFSINESSPSEWCYPSASYSKTSLWAKQNNTEDCCSWDGVTCDIVSGNVIGLNLSCSWLQGEFHPNNTIFLLSHLQKLYLDGNDFKESWIPSEFDKLVELTHLDLLYSQFSGQVSPHITQL
ncbi:Receptor-like protein [Quillaja saponaria]|uniref:Receptor-like protein n=1 Tax=Quillaja saponaria TaxID=32244 RepID=A0AAD7LT17_QUISA|nr:Receptor-like protein [Quillaja saponaria]